MTRAYYNEHDPKAAAWLRELIRRGLIAPGDVDERSISDVLPTELSGYTQCHFFAGIAGWSLALRLAGWPDDRPVWTGSCPCPPFSTAGKKKLCPVCGGKPIPHPLKTGIFACIPCGHEWLADPRHLWPEFLRLIAHCNPSVVFGEQVAGGDGLVWLAGVRATLEALAYGVGSSDLCAPCKGSPHIRQRLYWVAVTKRGQLKEQRPPLDIKGQQSTTLFPTARCSSDNGLAHHHHQRSQGRLGTELPECGSERTVGPSSASDNRVADMQSPEHTDDGAKSDGVQGRPSDSGDLGWADSHLVTCRDGKDRRVPSEPAFFPLANGVPARVVRLRGYGNAIVPQVAAHFIQAAEEAVSGRGFDLADLI